MHEYDLFCCTGSGCYVILGFRKSLGGHEEALHLADNTIAVFMPTVADQPDKLQYKNEKGRYAFRYLCSKVKNANEEWGV
jgi:hypothetical protein